MIFLKLSPRKCRPPGPAKPADSRVVTPRLSSDTLAMHLAEAMIGQTVDLQAIGKIVRGVVMGVFTEARTPKLVVNGMKFNLNQILTVVPTSFN